MGEFFKGWRRKAGLALLAMAVALSGVWMRSYVASDEIFIQRPQSHHFVGSLSGGFYWERWPGSLSSDVWPEYGSDYKGMISGSVYFAQPFPWSEVAFESHWWDRAGFHFGGIDASAEWWFLPYWSLVLPLTLLSAWLILGKRPKGKDMPRDRAAE